MPPAPAMSAAGVAPGTQRWAGEERVVDTPAKPVEGDTGGQEQPGVYLDPELLQYMDLNHEPDFGRFANCVTIWQLVHVCAMQTRISLCVHMTIIHH